MNNPTPTTADFLATLWGDGPHAICWLESDGRFDFFHIYSPDELPPLDRMQGRDFWFGVHPLHLVPEKGRGGATDVSEVHVLHADLDWADPTRRTTDELPTEAQVRARLRKLGTDLAPTAVVMSGHGIQAYWGLAFPVSAEVGQELQDRLTLALDKIGLDNGRRDIASIMRLPGTRNHKGEPVPVVIEALELDKPGYLYEYLDKRLPELPVTGLSRGGTKHHAGTVTDDQQEIANYVIATLGGHDPVVFRDGSIHLVRPGREAGHFGAAVIVGNEGDALLTVFTDAWPKLRKGSYVYDGEKLVHPSDPLRGITIVPGEPATSLPHPAPNLPDEFWNARPWLKSVREWAHFHVASADAVYGALRARIATLAPYNLTIETGVGTPLPLNVLSGLIANPGGGKSSSLKLARQSVPLGREDIYEGPMGSGEGLIECFFDWVSEENPDTGKVVKVKRQTKNAAFIVLDEGEALQNMGSRGGTTLLPTLRSAWSGEMIGQSNAAAETRRILSPGEYRMAVTAGFQWSIAAELMADSSTGTPQRFVLFNANDPTIPDEVPDEAPEVPHPPKTLPTITGPGQNWITLDMPIRREVRARALAVRREQIKLDELDVHRDANRLREAALLALMEGRTEVSVEDWALAGMVMTTSDELRRRVIELAKEKASRANVARGEAEGERSAAATAIREQTLVGQLTARLVDRLGGDGALWKDLARELTAAKTRHRFAQAVELAVKSGLVTVEDRGEHGRWIVPTQGE